MQFTDDSTDPLRRPATIHRPIGHPTSCQMAAFLLENAMEMKNPGKNKYDPSCGHGTGGSPNDNGAQGGGSINGESDDALMAGMVSQNRKYANPAEKEQGYDVKKGTM